MREKVEVYLLLLWRRATLAGALFLRQLQEPTPRRRRNVQIGIHPCGGGDGSSTCIAPYPNPGVARPLSQVLAATLGRSRKHRLGMIFSSITFSRAGLCGCFAHLACVLALTAPAAAQPGFGTPADRLARPELGFPSSPIGSSSTSGYGAEESPFAGNLNLRNPTLPLGETISEIRIAGATETPEAEIRRQIQAKPAREFDVRVIEDDVRRINRMGRFIDVRPKYTRNADGGLVVVYQVVERPVVRNVAISGNRKVWTYTLFKKAGIKEGDGLDPFRVEEGRRRLEEHYRNKGFNDVQIEVVEGNQVGDRGVKYLINEGLSQRIGWVHVRRQHDRFRRPG